MIIFLSIVLLVSYSNPSSNSSKNTDKEIQAAKEVLSKLGDKVKIDKACTDSDDESIVYFYYTQVKDHNNPEEGTFYQYCALHYKGACR